MGTKDLSAPMSSHPGVVEAASGEIPKGTFSFLTRKQSAGKEGKFNHSNSYNVLSTYCAPSSLPVFPFLPQCDCDHSLPPTDQHPEAQRGQVTWPRSHSRGLGRRGCYLRPRQLPHLHTFLQTHCLFNSYPCLKAKVFVGL